MSRHRSFKVLPWCVVGKISETESKFLQPNTCVSELQKQVNTTAPKNHLGAFKTTWYFGYNQDQLNQNVGGWNSGMNNFKNLLGDFHMQMNLRINESNDTKNNQPNPECEIFYSAEDVGSSTNKCHFLKRQGRRGNHHRLKETE